MAQNFRNTCDKRVLVGEIGVDSGLVFVGDPCYFKHSKALCNPDHWEDIIKERKRNDWKPAQFYSDDMNGHTFPMGVITPTNYGDGSYPCYITLDSEGRPTKLEVIFGEEEE